MVLGLCTKERNNNGGLSDGSKIHNPSIVVVTIDGFFHEA
jgi:hypothetical protein